MKSEREQALEKRIEALEGRIDSMEAWVRDGFSALAALVECLKKQDDKRREAAREELERMLPFLQRSMDLMKIQRETTEEILRLQQGGHA